jgi:hypothetical protein
MRVIIEVSDELETKASLSGSTRDVGPVTASAPVEHSGGAAPPLSTAVAALATAQVALPAGEAEYGGVAAGSDVQLGQDAGPAQNGGPADLQAH